MSLQLALETAGKSALVEGEYEMVPIADIWEHSDFQNRLSTDDSQVDIYVNKLKYTEAPPVELWKITDYENPEQLWLIHGHHRYLAYSKAKRQEIPAKVSIGTWQEAIMASCLSNLDNGLGLTKADIEKSCKRFILAQEELPGKGLSNRKIGKLFGLHNTTVGQYKRDLAFQKQLDEKGLRPGCRVEIQGQEPLKWRLGKLGFVGSGEDRNQIYIIFDYQSAFDNGMYPPDDFIATDLEKIPENIHVGDRVWCDRLAKDNSKAYGIVVASPKSDASAIYYNEVETPWNLSKENDDYLVLFENGLKVFGENYLELQQEEVQNWADGIDWQFVYDQMCLVVESEPEGITKVLFTTYLAWIWDQLNPNSDLPNPHKGETDEKKGEKKDGKTDGETAVEGPGADASPGPGADAEIDAVEPELDFTQVYSVLNSAQRVVFVKKQAEAFSIYTDRDLELLKDSIEQEVAKRSL